MDTPICDFVRNYAGGNGLRLHMPGHKGVGFLGMESMDITEIDGADSLYEADGIIARSEENAGRLFGCRTLYSTEGSSHCIRAMLYLVQLRAKQTGKRPWIMAGRNAHKTFLTAAALLDFEITWLYPENANYLSCHLTPEELDLLLRSTAQKPAAVYLTSPDYLGDLVDIRGMAAVCHKYGVWLVVDNAHGAYLRFLPQSCHPMDLGADLCCDSAHKTLPVLTGGAYLHLSDGIPAEIMAQAKNALAIFGSTSPSYLILQSLDRCNAYLSEYGSLLAEFLPQVESLKDTLKGHGYTLYSGEKLKLTLAAKPCGYTGTELSLLLQAEGIVPEFADRDYLVLMLTPEIGTAGLTRIQESLCRIPPKAPLAVDAPRLVPGVQMLSVREAMLAPSEMISTKDSLGRILAVPTVGCPPAVPVVVCGEEITSYGIRCLEYYGIRECCVVKEQGV